MYTLSSRDISIFFRSEFLYYCQSGTYSNKTNSSKCLPCPAGTYSSENHTICIKCPAGTYSTERSSSCKYCGYGAYSLEGAEKCIKCPLGTYKNGDTGYNKCELCPAGTYGDKEGMSSCSSCNPGYYSSIGETSCHICPVCNNHRYPFPLFRSHQYIEPEADIAVRAFDLQTHPQVSIDSNTQFARKASCLK